MKNTLILRRVLTAGIFLSLLTPFIVTSGMYFPFITGKAYFFRVLVEILFAGWLVLAIFDPSARPKKSCVLWSMISFLVIVLIANLQGTNPLSSFWSNYERMEGYVTLIHLFAYFLVVSSVFNTKNIWDKFLNVFVASTIAQGFWAILQALGAFETGSSTDRIDGTLGNATYLAGFMMLGVFVTLYLWIKGNKYDWAKYVYVSAIVIQLISIFFTATRGSLIAVIAGLFVSVLLYAILEPTKKHLRKVVAAIVVAVVLFVSLVFGFKESAFIQETTSLRRLSEISLSETTVFARFINWNIAWNAVKERPILGYGQGGYGEIFDKNYDVRMWNQEPFFDRVHNLFFDWLIAAGFLGILSYLALLGSSVYYIWKKDSEFSTAAKAAFTGFFVGYFIHVMFVFDSLTTYIILFFVFAFIHFTVAKPILLFERINISKNLAQIIAVVVLIGTPFVMYAVNAPSYLQNKGVIDAMRQVSMGEVEESLDTFTKAMNRRSFGEQEVLLQLMGVAGQVVRTDDVPQDLKQAYADLTVSEIKNYTDKSVNDARAFYSAGQFFAQIGDMDSSLNMFRTAAEISPNKQFMYQPIIIILLQQEKNDEALSLSKKVYEINPENDVFWKSYLEFALRAENDVLYSSLIEQAFMEGKGYRVVSFMEDALSNNPNNPQTYASLAVAYYRDGNPDEAIKTLLILSEKFPKSKVQSDDLIKRIQAGEQMI